MGKTRVVLSFDDGRKDNYDVVLPIIKEYGLTATFNIATAYVDGTIDKSDAPCDNPAMTIDDVVELYKNGCEIACHGDCHKNTLLDIENGLDKLRDWLSWPQNHKPGFASPQSNLTTRDIHLQKEKLMSMFSYIRIASYKKDSYIKRIVRKIAHKIRSNYLYCMVYKKDLGGLKDGFVAISIPVIHTTSVNQVKSLVREAEKEQKDCILMFHSIIPREEPFYDNMWSWDRDNFEDLCRWLQNERNDGMLKVTTMMHLL